MDIRITTQFGKLGAKYTKSEFNIDSKIVDMSIKQQLPEMNIDIDFPQVHIDMTETWADIGYKKVVPFAFEQAEKGMEAVSQGISRIAQEGDTIANYKGKGTAILSQISWQNSMDHRETIIDAIPHVPPKISFTGGLKINTKLGKVKVDVPLDFFPKINYKPGTVKIYLEQAPMIKVETVGKNIDTTL